MVRPSGVRANNNDREVRTEEQLFRRHTPRKGRVTPITAHLLRTRMRRLHRVTLGARTLQTLQTVGRKRLAVAQITGGALNACRHVRALLGQRLAATLDISLRR